MYPASLLRTGASWLHSALKLMWLPLRVTARPAYAAGVWPLEASEGGAVTVEDVQLAQSTEATGRGFRTLTLATVLSVFVLVTLGGVVRLTESGLGCPDWPLCHGKLIPPLDTPTLIEYSHRLLASVVGVLVLATALITWRFYRRQSWLLIPASLGLFLLGVQVLLGGVTVLGELSPEAVLAHLATAEALMATMVVVCLVALRGRPRLGFRNGDGGRQGRLPVLTLWALMAGYVLLLMGSYVTVSGAATACGQSWPLCEGGLVPAGYYSTMHMVHRVVAFLVGMPVVTVVVLAWRRRHESQAQRWAATGVGAVFLAQVLVGAAILLMGFPIAARVLHLSMGTLVWMGLVVLAVLSLSPPERGLGGVSRA